MPIHDWTRASDGVFHDFHQGYVVQLARRLNAGLLPDELYATIDRPYQPRGDRDPLRAEPDVLAVSLPGSDELAGGVLTAAPPRLRLADESAAEGYVRRADRIAVRTVEGNAVVAVFELVSAGNKSSERRLRQFARKCGRLIRRGVNVTFVDLHPPTARDPDGLHPVVWGQIRERSYTRPADKPLTAAAYVAGDPARAYVEPLAVGDELPDAPLFVTPELHVPLPLEAVYLDCFAALPAYLRRQVEPPAEGGR